MPQPDAVNLLALPAGGELVLLDIDVKRTDGPQKATSSSRGKRSKRSARSVEDAKGQTNPFARGFQAIGF